MLSELYPVAGTVPVGDLSALPSQLVGAVTALAGAVATVLGGVAVWVKSRSESANGAVDKIDNHMAKQDKRIDRLERKLERSETRERLLINYIFQLQLYIQQGGAPPGPPWPLALLPATIDRETQEDEDGA